MAEPILMYFHVDFDGSSLSPFSKQLVSCLVHTFQQGVYLADQPKPPIDTSTSAGRLCQKYVTNALRKDLDADKLFSLRRTGPSMKFILHHIPLNSPRTVKNIFQLCLWRTFSFGHHDHMVASLLNSNPPNLVALSELINTWGGAQGILIQAYGNFQVKKVKIPEMLRKLWDFAVAIQKVGSAETFTQVYSLLVAQNIPSLPQGGIVVWLICCDFAEYGLCQDPTAMDLAKHMLGKKSKPCGPTKGLQVAARMAGEGTPLDSVESLAGVFLEVMRFFSEPDAYGELDEVVTLLKDCERLQGRKISVADLEHGLCKMTREDSMRGLYLPSAVAGYPENVSQLFKGLGANFFVETSDISAI